MNVLKMTLHGSIGWELLVTQRTSVTGASTVVGTRENSIGCSATQHFDPGTLVRTAGQLLLQQRPFLLLHLGSGTEWIIRVTLITGRGLILDNAHTLTLDRADLDPSRAAHSVLPLQMVPESGLVSEGDGTVCAPVSDHCPTPGLDHSLLLLCSLIVRQSLLYLLADHVSDCLSLLPTHETSSQQITVASLYLG